MSSTGSENEKQDSADSQKMNSAALKQKLNAAISSYFFDSSSNESDSVARSDSESLVDIVKERFVEDIHSTIDEDALEDNLPEIEESVDDGSEDEIQVNVNSDSNRNSGFDAKLFSGAFEEVKYQSVDIEITEKKSAATFDEESSRYTQIVQDALKSSSKENVPTVLGSMPVPKTQASSETPKESGPNKNNEPLIAIKQKDIVHVEKKGTLSDAPKIGLNVPSSEKIISNTNESVKKQPLARKIDEAKKSSLSDVFSKKESVPSSRLKEKTIIADEKPAKEAIKNKELKKASAEPSTPEILFLYNEKHTEHNPSSISVKAHENPDRLIKAMWYLEKSGVFRNGHCTLMNDFDMVGDDDLLRVHEESYVNFVKSYSAAGGGFLGDSTYMTSRSFEVAKLSAGAAIKAGSLVADGKYPYAFVMTRPPGHHASGNKYGGYCLFNNVAILARYLQEKKHVGKIVIIDWDAHAGDGTMEIFYEDPTVMFVSLHRDPHSFYPRKGFSKEIGEGAGKGYTVNVEMPVGAGDDEYALAFEEVIMPIVKSFSPEFIICSCGFDAYYKEKNIGLSLTSEGFHRMTSMIRSVYPKNFLLIMEGGYHDFNGQLCHSVLSALLDEANPVNDKPEMSSFKKNQQQQVFAETQSKIAEVKKFVPMFS